MTIHPTAIIEDGAQIADSAQIGPYCLIGPNVQIDADAVLHGHVNVQGHTTIGEATQIFPFTSLGTPPQDLKFKGEASELRIGKRNMIREHVTMNPGTEGGGLLTEVGDDCLFMMATHVAHDCRIGNQVIMANNATIAGHVQVGDGAIIGGLAAVHQFVRIGAFAMIGGLSGVEKDVIPFGSVMGERAELSGLNIIGMKRRGLNRESIHALRNAFKTLFESDDGTLQERIESFAPSNENTEVAEMLGFLTEQSDRSFSTPKRKAS